jgi:hypothetical protein
MLSMKMKAKYFAEGNLLPLCINSGCDNFVVVRDWKNWSFKSECSRCENSRKKGKDIPGVIRHKKTYCENIDSRLGWTCPVPKEEWPNFQSSLDLDHLNGDHQDNRPENVDTYCKLCHGRKTILEGDCHSNKASSRVMKH